MTEVLIVLIPVVVSNLLTWVLTRRGNNAGRRLSDVSSLHSELDIYKTLLADNKQFLQEARDQIATLSSEVCSLKDTNSALIQKVAELTKVNEQLDRELKQLRKLVKQNIDENKLQRDCPDKEPREAATAGI